MNYPRDVALDSAHDWAFVACYNDDMVTMMDVRWTYDGRTMDVTMDVRVDAPQILCPPGSCAASGY